MSARDASDFRDAAPRAIAIFAPTRFEFDLVTKALGGSEFSTREGLRMAKAKMGPLEATIFQTQIQARKLPEILDVVQSQRPKYALALVTGLAAGLDSALRLGDLVLYDRCVHAQDETAPIDVPAERLRVAREMLGPVGGSVLSGSGLTVDHLLRTAGEKLVLGRRFNAQAADMESFEILTAMQACAVPTLVLRSISDEAGHAVPDFGRALSPDGTIRSIHALAALLGAPRGGLAIARGAWLAGRSLQRALRGLLANLSAGATR